MNRKMFVPAVILLCMSLSAAIAGDDEKAITDLIKNERKAYVDKDIDAWAAFWAHEPYVSGLWIWSTGYEYVKSFDSLKVSVAESMKEDDMGGDKLEKKIKEIHISGDMATVFLKELTTWKYAGEETDIKLKSTYVLQKIDGDWKFVSMTTFNKSSFDDNDFAAEWRINIEGYKFLWRDDIEKAIKVFELNTQLFPEAFNTWDSLAEAYMKKGENEKAIKYYKKSLELNAKNDNASKMIEKIEKGE